MGGEILREYYGSRAPEYDLVYGKPERQGDLRLLEHWIPAAMTGRSVLEIACGTGYWTRFIGMTARKLTAADASAAMIRIAGAKPESKGARFVRCDAYSLPFRARRFDAAFAGFWFSHVPRARRREFIDGMHRTLAPGAKVLFLDNRFVSGNSTPIDGEDGEGDTYQVRQLEDGTTYRVLKNFPPETELRETVAGTATGIRYHKLRYFWALEYLYNPLADGSGAETA
jgi:ubiquinone/menaquinone biosynthesis C-methylase UbiE